METSYARANWKQCTSVHARKVSLWTRHRQSHATRQVRTSTAAPWTHRVWISFVFFANCQCDVTSFVVGLCLFGKKSGRSWRKLCRSTSRLLSRVLLTMMGASSSSAHLVRPRPPPPVPGPPLLNLPYLQRLTTISTLVFEDSNSHHCYCRSLLNLWTIRLEKARTKSLHKRHNLRQETGGRWKSSRCFFDWERFGLQCWEQRHAEEAQVWWWRWTRCRVQWREDVQAGLWSRSKEQTIAKDGWGCHLQSECLRHLARPHAAGQLNFIFILSFQLRTTAY